MAIPAVRPSPRFLCKGTHAVQIHKWVEARRGPGALAPLLEKHSLPARAPVVLGGWYDAEALLSVIEDVARAEGIGVEAAVEEIARANAREDLKSVYRVFMKILAPQRVLQFLPRIWRQYFQFGTVEVIRNDPGQIELVTRDVTTRFVPWVRGGWRGFLPETILASGGRSPRVDHISLTSMPDKSWQVSVQATYVELR
jgi:hypothetical protein